MCPSPPVTPEAYDKTKDSVSLKWKLPRHDGKGRIFGYLVEYQTPGAVEWIPANETPEQCPDLHYVVTGLTDGKEYAFRIFTVDAAGKSDPAYVKQTIKVHDRLGKAVIYNSSLFFIYYIYSIIFFSTNTSLVYPDWIGEKKSKTSFKLVNNTNYTIFTCKYDLV